MIAVDTNLLVYSHREDSTWHPRAFACLERLANGRSAWAIPWPCIHEFMAISTHPRLYAPPTPVPKAIEQVAAWIESPSLVLLHESEGYWETLADLVRAGGVQGPQVHDARIAALCLHHGVEALWSADRDFSRFPGLRVVNPLIG